MGRWIHVALAVSATAFLCAHSGECGATKPRTGNRVGILVQGPPIKGIFRDAECLLWALTRGPVRVGGLVPASVSAFYTGNYAMLDAAVGMGAECIEDSAGRTLCTRSEALPPGDASLVGAHAVREGTGLAEWLGALDVVVTLESALKNVCALAHARGVRSKVVFLNLEWSDPEQLQDLARTVPGVRLVVKGAAARRVLASRLPPNLPLDFVPWSIPDNVVRGRRVASEREVRLLFVAGLGGVRNRRGGDIVLEGYRQLLELQGRSKELADVAFSLDFWSARHPEAYDFPVPKALLSQRNLTLHLGPAPRESISEALLSADLLLYPSRWEGFGLSLLEALHAGLPAAGTDGFPVNELIEDGHNGILLPATQKGNFGLSPAWEVSPSELAKGILRFAADPSLRRRITCPSPTELIARQHKFVLEVRRLLIGEASPVVLSFYAGPHPQYPRAELFSLGFDVKDIAYEDVNSAEVLAAMPSADFLLVSKVPSLEWLQALKQVRAKTQAGDKPIYMWFWDPIDYSEDRRRWFVDVGRECDAVFINEKGREDLWAREGVTAAYIEEGCMHLGDRGRGLRSKDLPTPATTHDVSFQGTVYPYPPDFPRVEVILHLLRSGAPLAVYGPKNEWDALNITALPPSRSLLTDTAQYGKPSHRIHRESKVTLSLSRLQPGTELYRSERLIDGAGAGGCVLSEVFPGLDLLLPVGSVLVASSPQEYLAKVAGIARNPSACDSAREAAMQSAWAFHTWQDSVLKFMHLVLDASLVHFPLPAGSQQTHTSCVRPLSADCCGSQNYNMRIAQALLNGPWRSPHSVEAALHFSAAIQDCPSHAEAWKGIAASLLLQSDASRALRSHVTWMRLQSLRLSQRPEASGHAAEIIARAALAHGPAVAAPVVMACSSTSASVPRQAAACKLLLEILGAVPV